MMRLKPCPKSHTTLSPQVERIFDPSGEDKYTLPALPMMESTALTSMPCGVCPVRNAFFHCRSSLLLL